MCWASPGGRRHLSPAQHTPLHDAVRDLPPLPGPNPLDELSPLQLEHELWWLADCPDGPAGLELRAVDRDADDVPPPERDARWTLDLQDPYGWFDADIAA